MSANWGLQNVQVANAEKEAALAQMLKAQQLERQLSEMAYAASAFTATTEASHRDKFLQLEAQVTDGLRALADSAGDTQESDGGRGARPV